MKRALKLVLPALISTEVFLIWSGVMGLNEAILVVVGIEALLAVVGVGGIILVVQRYRQGRQEGLDLWTALEDGLAVALPRKAARLAATEPKIFISLLRWTFRRVKLAEDEFAYHRRSLMRALLPMIIVTSPIELFVIHLLASILSPWGLLKWVLLVLGIYAILWLLGLYAALVTFPHRLEERGLRLYYGVFAEGFIPYEEIEEVLRVDRKAPSLGDGLQHVPEEDALYLSVGSKTNLTLHLRAPRSVRGFLKESTPAPILHLAAGDPDRLVRELRRCTEASTAAPLATVQRLYGPRSEFWKP